MDPKLENELYNIDPIFFKEAKACLAGEMNEMTSCMAFGCECGDGWFEPLKTFIKKVKVLNELGKQYNVQFVCNQLKEKFGTLRVYSSIHKINEDIENQYWEEGYEILSGMFDDALSTCVNECSKVCEKCGASGGNNNENIIETTGWISYICKKCARQMTENTTKQYDNQHKDNEFYGIDRITLFKQENAFLNLNHFLSFQYNEKQYTSIIHAYFSEIDPQHATLYNYISGTHSLNSPIIIKSVANAFGFSKIDNFDLLKNIVKAKFFDRWNDIVRRDLLLTKNKLLINMNYNHDNELGYCYCNDCKNIEKQNIYGKILMDVRSELLTNIEEKFYNITNAKNFINEMNMDLNIFEAIHNKIKTIKHYFVSNKDIINIKDYTLSKCEI